MEVRYMGFEQLRNMRWYRLDVVEDGRPAKHFTVSADLSLFHAHGVGIQEGPSLSVFKLTSDLENCVVGAHQLTAEDMVSYVSVRVAGGARRAEKRKMARSPNPRV